MEEKELRRLVNERLFTRAVDILETEYARPLIRTVEHVGESAYGCTLAYASWAALSRKIAAHLPGIVMPTRNGLVWVNGGGGPHGTLIDNSLIDPRDETSGTRLEGIISARDAVARTGYTGKVCWTLGGIGKRLLNYVSVPDEYRVNCEGLFRTKSGKLDQGYHRCIPGEYGEDARLYDVSGYYYNLFSRLDSPKKSLRVIIGTSGATFFPWLDGERERFQEVLKAIEGVKPLRNALIGSAQGSLDEGYAFTSSGCEARKARLITIPGRPGKFRAVALLQIRIGYELTQKEALTNNAVYSMIDSVILPNGGTPTVWGDFGFNFNLIHKGKAEIIARGNYSIGPEKKFLYREGFRTKQTEQGETMLPFQYHERLLE